MKGKKIFIIFCLIMVFILAISFASAGDVGGNSTSVDGASVIKAADTGNNVVKGDSGSFTQLNDKIQNAPVNGSVELDRNYTYIEGESVGTGGIVINKDITIDGKGYTIDGAGTASIFRIENNAHVILKNIKFINARGTNGAAISLTSSEKLK